LTAPAQELIIRTIDQYTIINHPDRKDFNFLPLPCSCCFLILFSVRRCLSVRVYQLEKHIWICAFMAVGVKYGTTVGEVESKHNKEVRALIDELASAATMVSS
jgi:predicted transporter